MQRSYLSFIIILCVLPFSSLTAQSYEIRAVNKGLGVIGVEARFLDATNTSKITDIVFGLKWKASHNIDLVNEISSQYKIKKSGVRILKNGFHYQAFFADNTPFAFPTVQSASWTEIMRITHTKNGNGTANFLICEKGFDLVTDPNIGIDLADFTPDIKDSASNVVLPNITLDIKAGSEKHYILVQWKLTNETFNKGFELQRSEKETMNFSPISWIEGKGDASVNYYEFADDKAEYNKEYFYRLKLIDKRGVESFSETRKAKLTGASAFSLTPNPAKNNIFLRLPFRYNSNSFLIRITDARGSVVYQLQDAIRNNQSVKIPVLKLTPGNYFVTIESDGKAIFKEGFVKL